MSDHEKDRGTLTALLGLMFVSGLILFVIGMVFPNVLWLFAIVFGFVFFIAVQYVVWGYWLSKHLRKTMPDDSEEEAEFLKKYGPQ